MGGVRGAIARYTAYGYESQRLFDENIGVMRGHNRPCGGLDRPAAEYQGAPRFSGERIPRSGVSA